MSQVDFYQVITSTGEAVSINLARIDTIREGEGIVTLEIGGARLRVTAESFAAVVNHADVGYFRC